MTLPGFTGKFSEYKSKNRYTSSTTPKADTLLSPTISPASIGDLYYILSLYGLLQQWEWDNSMAVSRHEVCGFTGKNKLYNCSFWETKKACCKRHEEKWKKGTFG
jgi:hypothetical protein